MGLMGICWELYAAVSGPNFIDVFVELDCAVKSAASPSRDGLKSKMLKYG